MNVYELCSEVYKRAFYHAAYNRLNNKDVTTTCCVSQNKVFFYDRSKDTRMCWHDSGRYFSSIEIDNFPSTDDIVKYLIKSLKTEEDKRKVASFIEYFFDTDKFVHYDLNYELLMFFKRHLRARYDDYVLQLIDSLWLKFISMKCKTFMIELRLMGQAFDKDASNDNFKLCMLLILNDVNVSNCSSKNLSEDLLTLLDDSGIFLNAEV